MQLALRYIRAGTAQKQLDAPFPHRSRKWLFKEELHFDTGDFNKIMVLQRVGLSV